MKQLLKTNIDWIFLLFSLSLTALIFSYMSVTLHNHFQTFGWDLGFFDQIIWKASRGDLIAYSTLAKENLLADHFQVVLYLLAPLYWIRSDVRMILTAQSILVVLAGIPLYALAKSLSKNVLFSFSIVVAFLLFLGTQWTILNEFHQMAFVPLFLSIFFYALNHRNKLGYWIGIGGLLITKEELGLLVASIGMLVFLGSSTIGGVPSGHPRGVLSWSKRTGVYTFIIGILSFFFLIYIMMPAISVEGIYNHMGFGEAGYTPIDVIKKSITNPSFFIKQMVYPTIKMKTVFDSFFAFGFLPLLAPIHLIPVVEQFVTRFIYAGPQFTKWANVNHHASPLGILLAVSTVYASYWIVTVLKKGNKGNKGHMGKMYTYVGFYILIFALLQDVVLHGPINSFFKPQFHKTYDWIFDNEEIIKSVPSNVSVAAQNSMFPHVSQRNEIYLLPEISNAQYIVVDFEDGPNKFSPLTMKEMGELVNRLTSSNSYTIITQKGKALLLHRKDI